MKITVLYVGNSLLAPLKRAEKQINREYKLDLQIAAVNCGITLNEDEWTIVKRDLQESSIVFIIHITDDANARLIQSELQNAAQRTVIAFNCMPDLMRLTRMGKLDFASLMKANNINGATDESLTDKAASSQNLIRKLASWMADTFKSRKNGNPTNGKSKAANHGQYVKLIGKLPLILKFIPGAGKIRDIKNYLYLFCYFLQPTPANIRSMVLYAIKHYAEVWSLESGVWSHTSKDNNRELSENLLKRIKVDAPENLPAVGIYHPDAEKLFESYAAYQKWYERKHHRKLEKSQTIGLLLMRPQIISDARHHYDALIRAIESQGLSVIPAISTFMDNRDACREFFIEAQPDEKAKGKRQKAKGKDDEPLSTISPLHLFTSSPLHQSTARVNQIVSLTGFSFVGGPAMNDSEAAVDFLKDLNVPFRSMVSLDFQSIENWQQSKLGINPVQTAMQVALPELDGATEPFVFGGLRQDASQPEPIGERCQRIAQRLARWNRLQNVTNAEKRLAFMLFCFPPSKGNIGTAADLDVMASVLEILRRLKAEGYALDLPENANQLRDRILQGNADDYGMLANVAYRMSVDEYRRLCPYVADIEKEWGRAPGNINANGREVLISGVELGNIFIGVQPTFGYEGDPMRMLAAESGAPHHGFMGLYTFVEKVFKADAVIHVGTHGALEFMPGKQAGLSEACWPDRLIGELPNIYLYSVNNPSEGTIAKRRSYAELISYLTPPIENAGLYKELVSMKELLTAYRRATGENERAQLFAAIQEKAQHLNL
ncbi:MAG: cobaltochelatase subunit CobN [Acidobacteriota bacterium]